MSDDNGTRLRNTSTLGAVDVPDLGQIIEHLHEVVVEDIKLAERLVATGHFIEVAKPGPKPADTTTDTAPAVTPAPTAEEPAQ